MMMTEFLKKHKLIDHLTTELELDKMEFVKRLRQQVDEGDVSFLSGAFEAFTSSDNDFVGTVSTEGFTFRRRRKMFERSMNLAYVTGSYSQERDRLVISTDIIGFRKIMLFYFGFLVILYLFFISIFLFSASLEESLPIMIILPILLHASIMFLLPYFLARRSVQKLKKEVEREFHFLARTQVQGLV